MQGSQVWFDDGTKLGYLVLGTITENIGTHVKILHGNKVICKGLRLIKYCQISSFLYVLHPNVCA